MILFFLRIVCALSFLFEVVHGMDELEKAQQALTLWRMQKINHIIRPLPTISFEGSSSVINNKSLKKTMHTSSGFCKHLKRFYTQRVWKYTSIGEDGRLRQFEDPQPLFDWLDLETKEMTVEGLPCSLAKEAYSAFSEGAWYFNGDSKVEAAKDAIKQEVALFVSRHLQDNSFKIKHVRFSDDFLYMLCLVIGDDKDFVVLFSLCNPVRFEKVKKLADCYVSFK